MTDTTEEMPRPDKQLIEAINERHLSRDKWEASLRAFEQLYRRYADQMLVFLSSRVADENVESVHRSVWQTVWQQGTLPVVDDNLRSWLHGIANREASARRLRTQKSRTKTRKEKRSRKSKAIDDQIVDRKRLQLMSDCLDQLDDDLATVVRRRLSGESYEVICFDLDVDIVKAREMYAKGKALISVYFNRAASRNK